MAFDGHRKVAVRLGRGIQRRGGALAEDADQGAPAGWSLAGRHGQACDGRFGWQAEGREQAGVEEGDNGGNS